MRRTVRDGVRVSLGSVGVWGSHRSQGVGWRRRLRGREPWVHFLLRPKLLRRLLEVCEPMLLAKSMGEGCLSWREGSGGRWPGCGVVGRRCVG